MGAWFVGGLVFAAFLAVVYFIWSRLGDRIKADLKDLMKKDGG